MFLIVSYQEKVLKSFSNKITFPPLMKSLVQNFVFNARRKPDKLFLFTLLGLSLWVHFLFFGHPNQTVFDEVHFGKFVSGYYTGEYYFDIHPPLGKLMIAGFAKIVDFKSEYNFTEIGKEFPDKKYLALRFLPTIAGTLLPVIIFLLALQLGISKIGAFTAGLLVVFDNALLTQSRLILLDPFLLLFGFTSLLFYFKKKYLPMAVFAGLAISIKWTGLSFIALPILIEMVKIIRTDLKPAIASFRSFLKLASFFFISIIVYFSVFILHFMLLPNPGSGDAFMKHGFRENNIVKNIWDLNIEMYKSNQRLTASHPYSSQWYAWPLMTRPIFYWVDSTRSPQVKDTARIYFLGNPVVWWTSTVAVAIGLWIMANRLWLKFRKYSEPSSIVYGPLAVLLGGYFINMLPFIGVNRVMFLYHYLSALIFAIMILCYIIDGFDKSFNRERFVPRLSTEGLTTSKDSLNPLRTRNNSRKIFTGIIIVAVASFLFFAPLSYGLPLSEKTYSARVWFVSWR